MSIEAAPIRAALIRAAPIMDWVLCYPCQASLLAHMALHVGGALLRTHM